MRRGCAVFWRGLHGGFQVRGRNLWGEGRGGATWFGDVGAGWRSWIVSADCGGAQEDLYLPFEGDNMLSIILSKALLLAEDQKIKDPTIVRQIERV